MCLSTCFCLSGVVKFSEGSFSHSLTATGHTEGFTGHPLLHLYSPKTGQLTSHYISLRYFYMLCLNQPMNLHKF